MEQNQKKKLSPRKTKKKLIMSRIKNQMDNKNVSILKFIQKKN